MPEPGPGCRSGRLGHQGAQSRTVTKISTQTPDALTSNLEDYLEAIYRLESEQQAARAKDIADRVGVQPASVTGALQTLATKGLIHYTPYRTVTLTEAGSRLAHRIVHRHAVLKEFLHTFLQLSEPVAETNACRLEHHIDDQSLERLVAFIQFVQHCPRTGPDWLQAFTRMCSDKGRCENCEPCIQNCLQMYLEKRGKGEV